MVIQSCFHQLNPRHPRLNTLFEICVPYFSPHFRPYLSRPKPPNMTEEQILERFNAICKNTLMETLDMKFVSVDREAGIVKMSMPVTPRVHQPMGLLHGGASAALAESIGSASSLLYADPDKYSVFGIEISCNHLKSKREGTITATAKILHKGRSTHLWEIIIRDEEENMISHCKLTNMVIEKRS